MWLVPFAAMTAGAAHEIVFSIFGGKYLSSGPILALLIFAALGFLAIKIAKAILIALDKPGWTFTLTGPLVPLALIGHLSLIPWMGGLGAAVVTTSIAFLGALASVLAVHRLWGIVPAVKTVLKSALCSGIALALAILWPVSGLMLIFKLVSITLIILLTFLILGEFTASEIAWVRSMLRFKKEAGTKRG